MQYEIRFLDHWFWDADFLHQFEENGIDPNTDDTHYCAFDVHDDLVLQWP